MILLGYQLSENYLSCGYPSTACYHGFIGTVPLLSSAINAGYIDIGCLTFGNGYFLPAFNFPCEQSPQISPLCSLTYHVPTILSVYLPLRFIL